jgi:hypothetical protein
MARTSPLSVISNFPYAVLSCETYQIQKVGAVALATLSFLYLHWQASLSSAARAALVFSSVTLLSEIGWRTQDTKSCDWFSYSQLETKRIVQRIAKRLLMIPLLVGVTLALGILPLPSAIGAILAGNSNVFFLSTVITPIAEEILFRGFLHERIEDLTLLASHWMTRETRMKVNTAITALVCATFLVAGKPNTKLFVKAFTFGRATFSAWRSVKTKQKDQSLLSPMINNSTKNIGKILGAALIFPLLGHSYKSFYDWASGSFDNRIPAPSA